MRTRNSSADINGIICDSKSFKGDAENMQDTNDVIRLSDGDEAVCAYFIENPTDLRRVIQLMPHGNPTSDFLQKLYSYAVNRSRKVDLANALLAYDSKWRELPQITTGRDWFCECDLPSACPEFFLEVRRYCWIRSAFESPEIDAGDFDEVDSLLDFVKMVKENVGDGVIDMEKTLTRIKLKLNGIIKAEKEAEKRAGL